MPLTTPNSNSRQKSTKVNPSVVTVSASAVQLLAANPNRLGATIWNDSASTLYIELGGNASVSSFTVKVTAGSYYECPFEFIGLISGVWSSASPGSALVREFI